MPVADKMNKGITGKGESISRGAQEAQSVKRLTLGFGSGHDLAVYEFESHIRLHAARRKPACVSPALPLPCLCSCALSLSLSLKINK